MTEDINAEPDIEQPLVPRSAEELLNFRFNIGLDRYGVFHYMTGFEGTGTCFWCGGQLQGRATRYCRKEHHWRLYVRHFCWSWARPWCFKRYGYRCANCGSDLYGHGEAHHIVPLNGGERLWTPWNLPWNLIALCHSCHQDVHAAMRREKLPKASKYELAVNRGQLFFGEMGIRALEYSLRNTGGL